MRKIWLLCLIVILFLGAKESEYKVTYTATLNPMYVPVVRPPLPDSLDVVRLARLIFCEAPHQSLKGKIAVGNVVTFRMKVKSMPLQQIIHANGQFDGIRNRSYTQWNHYKNKYPEKWKEALRASHLALIGRKVIPEGIYFYHNKSAATDRKWISYLTKYEWGKIGDHTFCWHKEYLKQTV